MSSNSRRRRPTLAEQAKIKQELRRYYSKGYTNIETVHEKTKYDPKTISKYFHEFDDEIEKEENEEFIKREKKERRIAKLRYEYLIQEQFNMLDEINKDIKDSREAKKPELGYFLSRHSDIVKTITNLIEKKSALGIHPTAGESLDEIIRERIEKYEESRAKNKR